MGVYVDPYDLPPELRESASAGLRDSADVSDSDTATIGEYAAGHPGRWPVNAPRYYTRNQYAAPRTRELAPPPPLQPDTGGYGIAWGPGVSMTPSAIDELRTLRPDDEPFANKMRRHTDAVLSPDEQQDYADVTDRMNQLDPADPDYLQKVQELSRRAAPMQSRLDASMRAERDRQNHEQRAAYEQQRQAEAQKRYAEMHPEIELGKVKYSQADENHRLELESQVGAFEGEIRKVAAAQQSLKDPTYQQATRAQYEAKLQELNGELEPLNQTKQRKLQLLKKVAEMEEYRAAVRAEAIRAGHARSRAATARDSLARIDDPTLGSYHLGFDDKGNHLKLHEAPVGEQARMTDAQLKNHNTMLSHQITAREHHQNQFLTLISHLKGGPGTDGKVDLDQLKEIVGARNLDEHMKKFDDAHPVGPHGLWERPEEKAEREVQTRFQQSMPGYGHAVVQASMAKDAEGVQTLHRLRQLHAQYPDPQSQPEEVKKELAQAKAKVGRYLPAGPAAAQPEPGVEPATDARWKSRYRISGSRLPLEEFVRQEQAKATAPARKAFAKTMGDYTRYIHEFPTEERHKALTFEEWYAQQHGG